jgi:phosphoribosyl 1,2-cyclic phosphodiesterase
MNALAGADELNVGAGLLQSCLHGGGHLSNDEAAEIIRAEASPRLRWLALAHLSEHNNAPDLALSTHRRYVGKLLPLHVASRYEVGEVAEV